MLSHYKYRIRSKTYFVFRHFLVLLIMRVCIVIHEGRANIDTFTSRPRSWPLDFYFKTKTIFHVLRAHRDQDQGLETIPAYFMHFRGRCSYRYTFSRCGAICK